MRVALYILGSWLLAAAALAAPIGDHYFFHSTEPHELRVIDDGTAALQLRLEMIERARESIDFEYMIMHKDETSRLVALALIDKVNRMRRTNPNFKVRMLVDGFEFHRDMNAHFAARFHDSQIEFRHYNMRGELWNLLRRNHRKVLIIDRKEALTGGRNIGDNYFDRSGAGGHNFMDRDVWVRGEGVEAMARTFDDYWDARFEDGVPISVVLERPVAPTWKSHVKRGSNRRNRYDPGAYRAARAAFERRDKAAHDFFNSPLKDATMAESVGRIGAEKLQSQSPILTSNSVLFVSDRPNWKQEGSVLTGPEMYRMIQNASKSVFIENGYFIPQARERAIFDELLEDGVDVSLLSNSRPAAENEFIANAFTLKYVKQSVDQGVSVYLYMGDVPAGSDPSVKVEDQRWGTHAKTVLIDGKHTIIGTANFEPRSVTGGNREQMIVVLDDPAFAAHVGEKINARKAQSFVVERGGVGPDGHVVDHPRNLADVLRSILLVGPLQLFEHEL